jgi:hypothetical protein
MRLVLCLSLALAAPPAWSGWEVTNEDIEYTDYIDLTTIRRDGDLRRVWTLVDWKQRAVGGYLSQRALTEFDCKEERRRLLTLSNHFGSMAGGDVLRTWNEPTGWRSIAPGTIAETILKTVCSK